jgi:hypothetical protein
VRRLARRNGYGVRKLTVYDSSGEYMLVDDATNYAMWFPRTLADIPIEITAPILPSPPEGMPARRLLI